MVPARSAISLTAAAVGARSYRWKKNGEVIDGESNETLSVAWANGGARDTYSATACYDVFGVETEGTPVTCIVENVPVGTVVIIR